MSVSSLPDGLLLLLSIAWLEHTFNKQGLKPEGASPQPLKRHGLRRAKALLCQGFPMLAEKGIAKGG